MEISTGAPSNFNGGPLPFRRISFDFHLDLKEIHESKAYIFLLRRIDRSIDSEMDRYIDRYIDT